MRSLHKLAAILMALAIGETLSLAQTRTVSGVVQDQKGAPLEGIAVVQDGTTNGVVTNADGTYTLSVPEGDVVLNFSSLGYTTQNLTLPAKQGTLNVTMQEDNMILNETVVVGYGTQKKVNLTGAIATVDTDDLKDRPSHSLVSMLQGSVPGLNITSKNGYPGGSGTADINIRGITSINGAEPLVLVDGAVSSMDRVNPQDVASISVIKDASAAAVYGARAAFGVILITTKAGESKDGKATVRYSGKWGWEEPTTSTDYEDRGYWSVYTVNLFWNAYNGGKYINYNDEDMRQLLARVNDKKENPERPWVVIENRNGRDQYVYYANTDWYHELYKDRHPVTQHNISVSGGNKSVKYYLSGAYDRETGVMKQNPDVFQKYNLRSKIDFNINKYAKMSNNTAFYRSVYDYPGISDVNESFGQGGRHALACYPLKNPDGTWIYITPYQNYAVCNGRHIIFGNDNNVNRQRHTDFSNTTELVITPVKTFNITGNFTYRTWDARNTYRRTEMDYSEFPGQIIHFSNTGAYRNQMTESMTANNRYTFNVYGTYEETFAEKHHVTATGGFNWEYYNQKATSTTGYNIMSDELSDFDLAGPNADGDIDAALLSGGQTEYKLAGFFGRVNYDYKGKYLFEVSGRYDGSSRFAGGHRWGFFPSASAGWRISEEPFFAPLRKNIDNLKLRLSYGSLGNQNVGNFQYLRKISVNTFSSANNNGYIFSKDASQIAKYSALSAPNASDLTWEKAEQWNLGLDVAAFNSRLQSTVEAYIRDTKDMLTDGVALPSVYGAAVPKMNAANLRTKGWEASISWRDDIKVFGHDLGYNASFNISQFDSEITKFDNPNKTFAKSYYKGMKLGEIWGYVVDGLFASDAEAKEYTSRVNQSWVSTRIKDNIWRAGDTRYVDLDGDNIIGPGSNTVNDPGDRKILGNSLARLHYGFTLGFDYMGFDMSTIFEGTGNHYWYPSTEAMSFWGPYGRPYLSYLPKNFLDKCWSEDNPDAYFPRPRGYIAQQASGSLGRVNSRYLQNLRYLRFKNLTVGYTLPKKLTQKIAVDRIRVYFTGENLCYWSPLKKHTKYIDPEAAYSGLGEKSNADANGFYPWSKSYTFGIDIQF